MKYFLPPKVTKNKKQQKGRIRKARYNVNTFFVKQGLWGLKAKESGRITPKQLEAVRQSLVRLMGRSGFIWFSLYPDISITKKPQEVRMGKGKGGIITWVARITKGRVLVEIAAAKLDLFLVLSKVKAKFPVKTRCINLKLIV